MIQVLPGDLIDNEPPYDDVIGLLCRNRLSASEFNINVKIGRTKQRCIWSISYLHHLDSMSG